MNDKNGNELEDKLPYFSDFKYVREKAGKSIQTVDNYDHQKHFANYI